MNAELYVLNESFAWNGTDSDTVVHNKLKVFCDLTKHIRQFPASNSIFVNHTGGFSTTIIAESGISLSTVINNRDQGLSFLGRDLYNQLLLAFSSDIRETSMDLEDLSFLLSLDDESAFHRIIVLNKTSRYPDDAQVSNISEWVRFRRYLIETYPESGENYLFEAQMCFPDLIIHEDNSSTLNHLVKTHAHKITECLSVLNDYFVDDLDSFSGTNPQFVAQFGASHGLDDSSFEGTADDKFYKRFSDLKDHYCEPHLKMYVDDRGNRNNQCRIYFEFPQSGQRMIYVGFICSHL